MTLTAFLCIRFIGTKMSIEKNINKENTTKVVPKNARLKGQLFSSIRLYFKIYPLCWANIVTIF